MSIKVLTVPIASTNVEWYGALSSTITELSLDSGRIL